jgi:hypothetical protein
VLTIADNLIADITSFRRPDLFAQFGLPDHLERAELGQPARVRWTPPG